MSSETHRPGTFGTPSKPETFETVRTHQKPISKPGTPKPSKPGTTFGTRNLSELIETWNHPSKPPTIPNPRTCRNISKPGTTFGSRNRFPEPDPGTWFLAGTAPARPEHTTEIYIV